MSLPKISIIVPAYNEARYIGRCLASLQNQDYRRPYEIIVADNNSTDKTGAIAKHFKVKVVKVIKPGPGPARNAGVETSRGQILAFIDADSIAPVNWLSYIDLAFASQPNLVALVGTFQFQPSTKILRFITQLALPAYNFLSKLLTGSFVLHGANFAIKKSVFKAVGGFNPHFFSLEDFELASRVSQVGQIGYLPQLKVATSGRRFHQGINQYLKYSIPIYLSVAILKKPARKTFPNIRN